MPRSGRHKVPYPRDASPRDLCDPGLVIDNLRGPNGVGTLMLLACFSFSKSPSFVSRRCLPNQNEFFNTIVDFSFAHSGTEKPKCWRKIACDESGRGSDETGRGSGEAGRGSGEDQARPGEHKAVTGREKDACVSGGYECVNRKK